MFLILDFEILAQHCALILETFKQAFGATVTSPERADFKESVLKKVFNFFLSLAIFSLILHSNFDENRKVTK